MFVVYEDTNGNVMLDARFPDIIETTDGLILSDEEAVRELMKQGAIPQTDKFFILPLHEASLLEEYYGQLVPADGIITVNEWNPPDYVLLAAELKKQDGVYDEAVKRKMKLLGARTEKQLNEMITRGLREAAMLLKIEVSGQELTPEQQARKQQLEAINAQLEAIDNAAETLLSMNPIPDDYTADKYWPV